MAWRTKFGMPLTEEARYNTELVKGRGLLVVQAALRRSRPVPDPEADGWVIAADRLVADNPRYVSKADQADVTESPYTYTYRGLILELSGCVAATKEKVEHTPWRQRASDAYVNVIVGRIADRDRYWMHDDAEREEALSALAAFVTENELEIKGEVNG